ncbi:MAG TPA: hypothetical protein DCR44_00615 [Acholeplasmatales bacterium]|nr:MAG: hypothetical protein A2Y16_03335 [Tenericutes bacterium GWF2_57_13]HAQ55901.1 hypothetical protein [Acholeplasmatales bacterium]
MEPLLFARIVTFIFFGVAIILSTVSAVLFTQKKKRDKEGRRVVFLFVSVLFLIITLVFQNVLVHAMNRLMIVEYITTHDLENDLQLMLSDVSPGNEQGWNVTLLEIEDDGTRKDYHALNPWQMTEPLDYTLYESRLLRAAWPGYDDALPLVYGATSTGLLTSAHGFPDILAFAPGTVILAWTWANTSADARFRGAPIERILSYVVIEGYDVAQTLAAQDPAVTAEIDRLFALLDTDLE